MRQSGQLWCITWDSLVKYLWGDMADYPDFIQAAVIYLHRRLLLSGLFYYMYYLGERVYEWELGLDKRKVLHDVPYYMLSTRSIRLERDIITAWRGSAATYHLAAFVPSAYAVFMQTQLLVHVPPPAKFDPFIEAEEMDRELVPPASRGQGPQRDGRTSHGARHRLVIIEETKEYSSEDSEETASKIS
ncbi:hypothetical protein JCGZ_15241 [Jatropha curcas]|uniref:Aminotransferase-like plant mobile domain-containing protein n=1 Tax=Jatropha curcas TaxID=180498 RepID=A0A067K322_JATCU|nr:hypothetical protein JCGZ_15241 [Jatropha curcas]